MKMAIEVTCFVNRWYDADGVPHYHGLYADYDTIEAAQRGIVFRLLACPVDLVYGPCDVSEMFAYLADVNCNQPDDDLDEIGDISWT